MVPNQKAARKLLEEHGWTMTRGGKHVVKMTKPGELAGVFASGDTVDELLDGLKEAVALYLGDGENSATELSELKLAVTA